MECPERIVHCAQIHIADEHLQKSDILRRPFRFARKNVRRDREDFRRRDGEIGTDVLIETGVGAVVGH